MTFQAIRRPLLTGALALVAAVFLGSCGGGGGASIPAGGSPRVDVLPTTGTIYAGIPATFSVIGGKQPYTVSSSEPSLLAVPQFLNGNSFTVIPANPSVVDADLEPDELPVRTVIITARDSIGLGTVGTATIQVARNFLTGYGLFLSPTNCPTDLVTAPNAACIGGSTAIQMAATINGNLYGNQQYRLEVIKGPYTIRNPATGVTGSSVVVTSDHTGSILALLEVPVNATPGLAVIRVVHIPTGVYADQVFGIAGGSTASLTVIPEEITFTGAITTTCGVGSADIFVFDGVPPYTAASSFASIIVSPVVSNTQPGRFTVSATDPTTCISNGTVLVTDSLGAHGTVEVTTEAGSTEPPEPVALNVAPDTLTLTCGTSGSVSVVGGAGAGYSATSTHPRVTALVSGSTLTITRQVGDGATVYPTTATVSVTDGNSIDTVTVTVPANCP